MKKDIENILNTMGEYARGAKLSRTAKSRLRSEIFERTSPAAPVKSPFMVISAWSEHFSKKAFVFVPASLAFVLLIGGGAAAAAENALPGDLLYPIKTSINEKAIGIFSNTPEEIAKYETELASRRLGEVTKLAVAGRLTSESRTKLESEVVNHLAKVDVQVSALKADNNINGAFEASSQVESSLRANAKVLEEVSQTANGETNAAVIAVKEQADQATLVRVQLEDQVSGSEENGATSALAQTKRAQAEEAISESSVLLDEVRALEGTDSDEIDAAEERLVIAGELLIEGDKSIESDPKTAYITYQKSARLAVEVGLVLEVQKEVGFVGENTEEQTDKEGDGKSTEPQISDPLPVDSGQGASL